jgi:hypothetical protein
MKRTIAVVGLVCLGWLILTTPAEAQAPQSQPQPAPSARPRQHRQRSVEKRLKKFDTNNDGRITRDEWTRRPKKFDRLDLNHDGVLTSDELQQAAARHRKRRR